MPVTRPVFSTCFIDGKAKIMDDGRKVTVPSPGGSGFALFGGAPIAAGVFRCSVVFGAGPDPDQHMGVLPASAAAAATVRSYCETGFSDDAIKGWGCRLERKQAVTAGVAKDNAHGVHFHNKTVEMVVDAKARTVVIGNPGGAQCTFENVVFPVIPAINIYGNTATLESSSHEMPETPEEKQAREAMERQKKEAQELQERKKNQKAQELEKKMEMVAAAMEQKMSEKVAVLEQKVVAAQQTMAEDKEATGKLFREQDKKFADEKEATGKLIAAQELRIAAQDREAIALRAEISSQADAIRMLEARLFKQSSGEAALEKSLTTEEASVKKHTDAVASLETLAATGTKGLAGSIAEEKSELEKATSQAEELRRQLAAAREKKALVSNPAVVTLEEDVETKIKQFQLKMAQTMLTSIKEPLDAKLDEIRDRVQEINTRANEA